MLVTHRTNAGRMSAYNDSNASEALKCAIGGKTWKFGIPKWGVWDKFGHGVYGVKAAGGLASSKRQKIPFILDDGDSTFRIF